MNNPYTPGIAGSPPVLAGRDEELQEIFELTDRLVDGQRIHQETILYGPRGNGKTSLLHKVTEELEEDSRVRPIFVQAPSIRTPEQVYRKLLGESPPSQQTDTTRIKGDLGFSSTRIGGEHETSKVTEIISVDREESCIARMNEEPTLLMVDEAQRISSESLDAILALTDAARRGKTKFAVILAGTPMLPSHLRKMDVSYLNRAPRRRMERLDTESTHTALFQPMESAGFNLQLSESQRHRLIEQTQCYPHFIQSVGHAIWDAVEQSGHNDVDATSITQAKPRWEKRIKDMYEDRLSEIDERELTLYARALAGWFRGGASRIYADDVTKAILKCKEDADATSVRTALEDLGYIWRSAEHALEYEPGIPSLMDHVHSEVREREDPNLGRSSKEDLDLEL